MKRLLFIALILGATGATAQMYRWVDHAGKVHYSDTPPPPAAAKSVQQKKLAASVVETSQLPFQLQEAIKNFPVTLYTSPSCKDGCPQARELLAKRGVPFKEVSVADEPSNALLKKVSGANQVPTLVVGTQAQIGYEPGAFNTALDTAGYPRTAVILPGAAKAAPQPAAPAPEPPSAAATPPAAAPGAPEPPAEPPKAPQ